MILSIKNLTVSYQGKILLHDINMTVADGARHLLRGRNGSGKTTLAQTVAGNPDYKIESGSITFEGRNITNENATTRALLGIFIGAQNVPEIPGLTVISFLKHSAAAHAHFQTGKELSMGEFLERLETARTRLDIPKEWLNRSINVGFSGGERKRLMFLRLALTAPKLAILDEPDSGADASAQKLFAGLMNEMPKTTFLFISHQEKFTELACPTAITTLDKGKIVI
ncbi:MAG: ATP-binding cassette domain-containing protein [Alphaproteobacteria bacterium]|nr:ATP-binding cassette domain-containing protein [Alphaproteobacteria bacterium]